MTQLEDSRNLKPGKRENTGATAQVSPGEGSEARTPLPASARARKVVLTGEGHSLNGKTYTPVYSDGNRV